MMMMMNSLKKVKFLVYVESENNSERSECEERRLLDIGFVKST